MSRPDIATAFRRFVTCAYAQLLPFAWRRETSDPVHAHDAWTPDRLGRGQSAVTALMIQSELGGDILMTEHFGKRHFYNRLPDGLVLDFIRPLPDDDVLHPGSAPASAETVRASELHVDDRLSLLIDRFEDVGIMLETYAQSLKAPV